MRIENYKKMARNERNKIDHMATLINGYAHDLSVFVLNAQQQVATSIIIMKQ